MHSQTLIDADGDELFPLPIVEAVARVFTPSPQQQAFFDWILNDVGSCVVEAVAGAGKTTTLIHALSLMSGTIFFGAYSRAIADEIAEKTGKRSNLTVGTMHAAGWSAYRKAFPKVKLNNDKCRDIFREACSRNIDPLTNKCRYSPFEGTVLRLVGYAKQAGLGALKVCSFATLMEIVEHFDVELVDEVDGTDNTQLILTLVMKTLKASNELDHEQADFDDMIYVPLARNLKIWQYDWVLVDEAQDTNATRRELALRMLKPDGRLVAVGDRHQAIFGFTGADSDSLDQIAKATNAKYLPLTTTYRCPKAVVAFAQTFVSHIHAADTAPEGEVIHTEIDQLTTLAVPGDAIICRNNAPLVTYVYKFIAKGIAAKIEGREIGEGLKTLAKRWKVKSLHAMLDKLEIFLERETKKYLDKEQGSKAQAVEDKVECLRVIIARVMNTNPHTTRPVLDVLEQIDSIFSDKQDAKVVTFVSGHRSKGREWNNVFWLTTGPSPWAKQDWEIEQETNIMYVIATRAKCKLTLMVVPKETKEKEA